MSTLGHVHFRTKELCRDYQMIKKTIENISKLRTQNTLRSYLLEINIS